MASSTPPYAELALKLMEPDWKETGVSDDLILAPTDNVDVQVERLTALLLVRLVAVVAPLGTYPDLSITSICKNVLKKQKDWPMEITDTVIAELKEFVKKMFVGYKPASEIPYHSQEHCSHVVLSTCKLMDMMLKVEKGQRNVPPAFGLRNDPMQLFALAFSALIHDVEHQGIPNRQLSQEKDRLAVLYNDQSIAENWSLYVGFSEFLQDEFQNLRRVAFGEQEENYPKFRKTVITLVLATDIASPERTQVGKSKWKEAFGDPFETVERKVRAEMRRASLGMTGKDISLKINQQRRGTGEHSVLSFEGKNVDDESLSGTPENSDNEDVGELMPVPNVQGRKASMGSMNKYERRMSSQSRQTTASARYRMRLGILRTVDLSGETLEAYSRSSSHESGYAPSGSTVVSADHAYSVDTEADDPDELRAIVVLETIMGAADVGHNLQGFPQMAKWSNRLYMELRKAFVENRGVDVSPKWFENQIGFLESYLLPLAFRLEDTGVFGDYSFSSIVEDNRDQWLTKGYDEAQAVIAEGAEKYPKE